MTIPNQNIVTYKTSQIWFEIGSNLGIKTWQELANAQCAIAMCATWGDWLDRKLPEIWFLN